MCTLVTNVSRPLEGARDGSGHNVHIGCESFAARWGLRDGNIPDVHIAHVPVAACWRARDE